MSDAASILQYIGSPFTNVGDAGAPMRIGMGSSEPTRWRYIRIQGKIQLDETGAGELIWMPDPANWPVPMLQSDIVPGPFPTAIQSSAGAIAVGTNISTFFDDIDDVYKGLSDQLYNNPPADQRFAGGGVRVWSLAGELQPLGIIRAAPLDSGLLHRVLMGNTSKHAYNVGVNPTGDVTNPASGPPTAGISLIDRITSGVFANGSAMWPGNWGGVFSPSGTENQGTWKAYLSAVAEFCEYAGEYKLYEGVKGASIRSNPSENFTQPTPWMPRSMCVNIDGIGEIPTILGVDASQTCMMRFYSGIPGTDVAPNTLNNFGGLLNYSCTAGALGAFDTGATRANLEFSAVPSFIVPNEKNDSSQVTFFSEGCYSSTTYANPSWSGAQTLGPEQIPVGAANTVTVSMASNSGTNGGLQSCRYHSFAEAMTGMVDNHKINGGWTSGRINLSGFTGMQVLFTEVVYMYEDVPLLPDPMNAQRAATRTDEDAILSVLSDRGAFPIVTSGHSFFANVKAALARVGRGLQYASGIVQTLSTAAALF